MTVPLAPSTMAALEKAEEVAQLSAMVQSLDKRCAELEAENERLLSAMRGALSYTRDGRRAFTDVDIMGEMVPIRLSGLCLLAEALEPGCRDRALDVWLTEVKSAALLSFDPAI